MTDKEKQLAVGIITSIYTHTFDGSKSLEEQCEDFITLGKKIIEVVNNNIKEEDKVITQKIKFHEDRIKDLKHEMYINSIISCIPQVNIINKII